MSVCNAIFCWCHPGNTSLASYNMLLFGHLILSICFINKVGKKWLQTPTTQRSCFLSLIIYRTLRFPPPKLLVFQLLWLYATEEPHSSWPSKIEQRSSKIVMETSFTLFRSHGVTRFQNHVWHSEMFSFSICSGLGLRSSSPNVL